MKHVTDIIISTQLCTMIAAAITWALVLFCPDEGAIMLLGLCTAMLFMVLPYIWEDMYEKRAAKYKEHIESLPDTFGKDPCQESYEEWLERQTQSPMEKKTLGSYFD